MRSARFWIVLLAALAACSKSNPGESKPASAEAPVMPKFDQPEKPAEPAAPAAPSSPPVAGDTQVVKLLEPGAEPRKPLRFRLKTGDKQQVAMKMKMNMDMNVGGNAQKIAMPTITMIMDVSVKSVAANGDIAYGFVFSDLSVGDDGGMPAIAEALKGALAPLKGMAGKGTISNRGLNRGIEMEVPPGANPQVAQMTGQMKDAMSQMAAPVPEEPVGVGAKWQVGMTVNSQGMAVKQLATFEVTAIDGPRFKARTAVQQSADPQPVSNPAMPSLKMQLLRMSGDGKGETTFDLGRIIPPMATADIASEVEMTVEAGAQKQNMSMKMQTALNVAEK